MSSDKYQAATWNEPTSIYEAHRYQAALLAETLDIQGQLLASNARDRSDDLDHLEWRRRAQSALNFRQQLIARYQLWILDNPQSPVETAKNEFVAAAQDFIAYYDNSSGANDNEGHLEALFQVALNRMQRFQTVDTTPELVYSNVTGV